MKSMENCVTVEGNIGSVEFNFENRKIVYRRKSGIFNKAMKLDENLVLSFDEITGVELEPPGLKQINGSFCFLVNGKKLFNERGIDKTEFIFYRKDQATVEGVLTRLQESCVIKRYNGHAQDNMEVAQLDEAKYTLKNNVGDTLLVFETYLILKHKGALNFIAQGFKGDKRIMFQNITAIEFRKSVGFTSGYIQFTIPGGRESLRGTAAAAGDENSIVFSPMQNDDAETIVNYIEQRRTELAQPAATVVQPNSSADELRKFKELCDDGIITEEEFNKKKAEILGL